mmetsp:Transcript_25849/g.73035  ORF Transcript_25849/g.73035 Transcript_25849/m.73035 type:complete len:208 (+) Transcript_25849:269-892(+)
MSALITVLTPCRSTPRVIEYCSSASRLLRCPSCLLSGTLAGASPSPPSSSSSAAFSFFFFFFFTSAVPPASSASAPPSSAFCFRFSFLRFFFGRSSSTSSSSSSSSVSLAAPLSAMFSSASSPAHPVSVAISRSTTLWLKACRMFCRVACGISAFSTAQLMLKRSRTIFILYAASMLLTNISVLPWTSWSFSSVYRIRNLSSLRHLR